MADFTLEQQKALALARARARMAQQPQMGVAEDVGKSALTGIGKGIIGIPGAVGDVREGIAGAGAWIGDKLGVSPEAQTAAGQAFRGGYGLAIPGGSTMPTSNQLIQGAQDLGVPFHEPQTGWGTAAELTGEIGTGFIGAPIKGMWQGVARLLTSRGVDDKAARVILKELEASGMSPQQAEQRLAQLGPEGMIADVSPGMQVHTGATAIADSGAGNTIAQRLAMRREGGHGRVSQDLDAAFGPPQDPYLVEQATRATQRTTGPAYQTASQYAVDTAPVADLVQQEILRVGPRGPYGQALQEIRRVITDRRGNLVSQGDRVHAVRQQLDMMIEQAQSSGQRQLAAQLGRIRSEVDSSLKGGIPGFAEADKTFADAARQQRAYDQGRTGVLRGGPETMTPAELADIQSRSSVPENMMRQQGTRTEIDRQLSNQRLNPGTTVDRLTSRDWNDDKMRIMLGQQRAEGLGRTIDREATFTETSGLGEPSRGSRTAQVAAAAQRIYGRGGKSSLTGEIAGGAVAGGMMGGAHGAAIGAGVATVNRVRQKIAEVLTRKSSEKTVRDVADKLTATGASRDEVLKAIKIAKAQSRGPLTGRKLELMVRALLGGSTEYRSNQTFGLRPRSAQ